MPTGIICPGAEDVRMIENWHLGDYVSIGEEDYVCVMTRGHKVTRSFRNRSYGLRRHISE